MLNQLNQRINQALARLRFAFRGVLARTDSTDALQTVQAAGLSGEQLQDAELFQHYGFTSTPLPGTKCIALPLNGRTSHSVIIATEHARYRLRALAPGEVALYTDEGAHVILRRGRIIEVVCDEYRLTANRVTVSTSDFTVTAKNQAVFDTPLLHGTHEVSDGTSTLSAVRTTYNGHSHHHGDPAGDTDAPHQKME